MQASHECQYYQTCRWSWTRWTRAPRIHLVGLLDEIVQILLKMKKGYVSTVRGQSRQCSTSVQYVGSLYGEVSKSSRDIANKWFCPETRQRNDSFLRCFHTQLVVLIRTWNHSWNFHRGVIINNTSKWSSWSCWVDETSRLRVRFPMEHMKA